MSDQSRIEQELSDSQMSYDSRIEEFIAWLKEDIPTHPEPRSRIEEQLASMTPGGGGSATLVEKSIIQNGIYNASDDEADGYSKVTVEVPEPPAPTLIEKSVTENGVYNASSDNADGYSKVTVNVPADLILIGPTLNQSVNYGSSQLGLNGLVVALSITDEATLNSNMNTGWDGAGANYYMSEMLQGAYAGYTWSIPKTIDSVKLWIGRYVYQNADLTVTVQTRDVNGDWNDVEDFAVSTNLSYPLNVFECIIPNTPIYGVRWCHYKGSPKSGGNNIVFFGMKYYGMR